MGAYEKNTENGSLKGTNRENTRSFNLYRDQSSSLNLLNADKFSGGCTESHPSSKMERKTLVVEFLRPP